MLGKKNNPPIDKVDTIIGQGTIIEGNINSTTSLRIDGEIKGEIKVKGHVAIGENGKIKGDIYAYSLTLEGEMAGNITATDSLHLSKESRLTGDIKAKSIEIEPGAAFNGTSLMTNRDHVNTLSSINKEPQASSR